MYYDIRMRYAKKQEKTQIKKIEEDIGIRINEITNLIRNRFSDYVLSFGLTGPMAHGEATIFFHGDKTGSDVDLAIVTKYRSLRKQKALEREIRKAFGGTGLETGPLFFAPTIFERPDLLFSEYARAGQVLFGEHVKCNKDIAVWEAAKILTSRCGAFFENISFSDGIMLSQEFHYAWSKSVMAVAEAMLVLENRYAFSIQERTRKIKNSKYARHMPGFLNLYQKAYICRYTGKLPKQRGLIADTASFISFAFNETAKILTEKSGKDLADLGAPFPSIISTRFFYFINMLKNRHIGIPLSEPLVKEFAEMGKMFEQLKAGEMPSEKARQQSVELWKHAERFWLPY